MAKGCWRATFVMFQKKRIHFHGKGCQWLPVYSLCHSSFKFLIIILRILLIYCIAFIDSTVFPGIFILYSTFILILLFILTIFIVCTTCIHMVLHVSCSNQLPLVGLMESSVSICISESPKQHKNV